jgi:hypothetical protein
MKYNFIIPYRNRKEHLDEFIKRFTDMLKDKDIDAHFFIIHQINPKEFNRGAMKNIGFLEIPKSRSDGLFIFHDVDTYPTYWGSIQYDTKKGEFRRPIMNSSPENLGLICCCWKEDFERTNGFANYWGWGSEDAALYFRAKLLGITINENNMISYKDNKYIINREHYRNNQKEHYYTDKNSKLLDLEKYNKDTSNGLSDLEYEVLSSFELAPRFTILNVDFNLKSENNTKI